MSKKEEQIKAWFKKASEYIPREVGIIIEHSQRYWNPLDNGVLDIKRDYRFFCGILWDIKQKVEVMDLISIILRCLAYLHYTSNGKGYIFFSLLEDTLIKKNRDYGNSFDRSMDKFGWVYLAIELDKKKNRLKNLLRNKQAPNYESLEDTLLDIAGYCVLALIYLENKGRE